MPPYSHIPVYDSLPTPPHRPHLPPLPAALHPPTVRGCNLVRLLPCNHLLRLSLQTVAHLPHYLCTRYILYHCGTFVPYMHTFTFLPIPAHYHTHHTHTHYAACASPPPPSLYPCLPMAHYLHCLPSCHMPACLPRMPLHLYACTLPFLPTPLFIPLCPSFGTHFCGHSRRGKAG